MTRTFRAASDASQLLERELGPLIGMLGDHDHLVSHALDEHVAVRTLAEHGREVHACTRTR